MENSEATNEKDDEVVESPAVAEEPEEVKGPEETELPKKANPFKKAWSWLRAKPVRLVVAAVVTVLLVSGVAIGATDLKYPVLGAVWKSSVGLRVVDAGSSLPVAHATVTLAGQTEFTDKTGAATFTHVKPGKTTVVVTRVAYATSSQAQTIGFGDITLNTVKLKATGVQVVSNVSNVLTGGSVEGVEVKAGDVQATTDANGKAVLVFPPDANNTTQDIEYSKDNFNTLKVSTKVQLNGKPIAATVVPAGKVYYLSNRSGKIDLYESNLDGSEPTVVLPGTGSEDTDTGILTTAKNPDYLALVSSREGKRDAYGNVYHGLFIFNTASRKLTKIEDTYAFVNYRAWVDDSLVYEKYPATGVGCPDVKAYAPVSQKSTVLISASGTGTCPKLLAPYDDGFFYSLSAGPADKNGIYFGQLGGKAAKRVAETPSASIVRQTKHTLLSVYYSYNPDYTADWQSIDLEALTSAKVANGPSNTASRTYNDSVNDKASAFIEERDGKTELYLTDSKGGNEKKLTSLGSVNQFVNWVGDDYIVFSVTKSDENALYVVAVPSGKVTKLADFYRANSHTYGGGSSPGY